MDPSIWSQVPLEILLEIVRFAVHSDSTTKASHETTKKWLEITSGNKTLYGVVLTALWAVTTISWHHLTCDEEDFCERDEDENVHSRGLNLNKLLRGNKRSGFIHDELFQRDHGTSPSQFVEVLKLRLAMSRTTLEDFLPLSHKVVRQNLELLLPSMKSLHHIDIQGPPSDTILDVLAGSKDIRLRSFTVDSGYCDYHFSSPRGQPNLDLYSWTKLASFKTLTDLSIGQFSEEQCLSFCLLVQDLPRLQFLELDAKRTGHPPDWHTPSPLRPLFQAHNEDSDMEQETGIPRLLAVLPSTFRRLRLQDVFHTREDLIQIQRASPYHGLVGSSCQLESLVTDFVDLQSTRNLLSWLPNTDLTTLKLAPVMHDSQGEMLNQLEVILNTTNEIMEHYKLSLQSILFANAWQIPLGFADQFNGYWDKHFAITDVVLGTRMVSRTDCKVSHDDLTLTNLPHTLFGCDEHIDPWGSNINRWGSKVQRLRIDWSERVQEYFDAKSADLLKSSSLQQLRVLVLGHNDPDLIDSSEDVLCGEFARCLARTAPPGLRSTTLFGYTYWLSEKVSNNNVNDNIDDCDRQVVQLIPAPPEPGDVYAKAQQAHSSWLTPEDKQFLNGLPNTHYLLPRQHIAQQYLNPFWLHLYNFMVARRL